jgi:hypothetical protein
MDSLYELLRSLDPASGSVHCCQVPCRTLSSTWRFSLCGLRVVGEAVLRHAVARGTLALRRHRAQAVVLLLLHRRHARLRCGGGAGGDRPPGRGCRSLRLQKKKKKTEASAGEVPSW